jgi:DNA-directed RNA polymerase subunit RPC12/RpoP
MNERFQTKEERNQRKYKCFVCGREYTDFAEFKEHIIDEHEEGTDYVFCPLARCQAPVRDVRTHFKARHPHEKLPKKGMMRATQWRDIKKGGKLKKRKPNPLKGWYTSTKMKKDFHFNSSWEQTVYELLDTDYEVMAFEAEPFEIDYIHNGKARKYIPDILVLFVDGHRELWEIKPANQTSLGINQAKWSAAEKACKVRGWKFVTVTETVISKLKKKVYVQLNEGK